MGEELHPCVLKKKIIWIIHISCVLSSSQPLELLVEKTVSTSERQMGVGESLRRVFECIASGTLLEGAALSCHTKTHVRMSSLTWKVTPFFSPKDGPGIKDPCEKEAVDGLSVLTLQQREEITQSAQVTSCRVCTQACWLYFAHSSFFFFFLSVLCDCVHLDRCTRFWD